MGKHGDNPDLRYISLGAGVQSTCLYLMAIEGAVGPTPDLAIFADPQAESGATYKHLRWLVETFSSDIPIKIVTKGSLTDAIEMATDPDGERFASVPFWSIGGDGRAAPGRRHCTREYKIDVVKKAVREVLELRPRQRAAGKFRVEEWIGISTDEITRATPSRYSWVTSRWPLIYDLGMSRQDCLDWMESRGYPRPPRSACTYCPWHNHQEWLRMREEDPDGFAEAVRIDEKIREGDGMRGMRSKQYVHRSLRPLAEVIDDPEWTGKNQGNLFENECTGGCGV